MSKETESLAELRELLAALCEGELDVAGYARIEQLVRGNPSARSLYVNTLLLHSELHWASSRPAFDLAGRAISDRDDAQTPPELQNQLILDRQSRVSRSLPLFGAAVAAGLLVSLGTWLFRAAVPLPHEGEPPPIVAELRANEGCVWADDATKLAEGSKLNAGQRLQLTTGVARLAFGNGAIVLVESPAAIEMISSNSLRLERGTVAVRSSGPKKDFSVISPDASIVDLGTSFAVHYDEQSATEVEVIEGAVEVFPQSDPSHAHVLGIGTNVSVGHQGKEVTLLASRPEEYRFAATIERLWEDIRAATPNDADSTGGNAIEAGFSDPAGPDAVDAFYDAKPGRGWLTPWVASGNPTADILLGDAQFGEQDPFLKLNFRKSFERAIAREYGRWGGFDPSQPHVITWRWRFEGNPEDFGDRFNDRISFYGNPFFRRNSWPTNSWLIGVSGGSETRGERSVSTEWIKRQYGPAVGVDAIGEGPRQVFPMQWYLFNASEAGPAGAVFDRRNMVNTGMPLKFNVVYRFAVAVYPQQSRYDAAIRDDEQTFVRTGLAFRSAGSEPANVLHFVASVNRSDDNVSFSLDSIRIEPLSGAGIEQQLEIENADNSHRKN